jgi:hypothetical protein
MQTESALLPVNNTKRRGRNDEWPWGGNLYIRKGLDDWERISITSLDFTLVQTSIDNKNLLTSHSLN